MGKIRVLIADDNENVVERVRVILGADFEVVGAAFNGRDAVAETQRLDPDVLVVDISMPILDGLQAARRLRVTNPRTKIVFLTVHRDQDFVAVAFSAGASAYVTKSDVATDLIPAINDAFYGRTYISHSVQS
jgi:DNA-binding NarL/FixJ family response regulator